MRKTVRSFKLLAPRPRVRSLRWFENYIFEPNELRPFSPLTYPHVGAPGGPCDMLDDPWILEMWLQWGSRLGKTMFSQSATLFMAATNPAPMLFASATQRLAVEVTSRTYRILEHCRPLRKQMRPPHRRKQDRIDFDECRVYVAWSKSVATLSDKGVRFGHANEIDKWEHVSTSTEADPLKLWDDRFKEYAAHKKIKEGTPSVKGRSRIERGRLSSSNCSLFVPCPHCGTFQKLEFGAPEDEHGLKWEKLHGKSDKSKAYETAYYRCVNGCHILSHERAPMMRGGVWVPEGCTVDAGGAKDAVERWQKSDQILWEGWDKAYWVKGQMARPGRSASSQLSSLYALAGITWGTIAAEFIEVKDRPGDLQNFINQWLGETWERVQRRQTWEELADRLIVDTPIGIVPAWASLVTCAIDRQQDFFVYVVDAWGPDRTSQTIQYGQCDTFDDVRTVVEAYYHHEDEGEPIQPAMTLIDSGYRPQGVYEFCRDANKRGTRVWPCKGSSATQDADIRHTRLGVNTSMPGMILFHVDSMRTQAWIDQVLHTLRPGDSGSTALYGASKFEHQDILEQLLNDAPVLKLDSTNHEREVYERIDTGVPNDYRDCRRYSYAAMLVATRGRPIRPRGVDVTKKAMVLNTGATRPDGRAW